MANVISSSSPVELPPTAEKGSVRFSQNSRLRCRLLRTWDVVLVSLPHRKGCFLVTKLKLKGVYKRPLVPAYCPHIPSVLQLHYHQQRQRFLPLHSQHDVEPSHLCCSGPTACDRCWKSTFETSTSLQYKSSAMRLPHGIDIWQRYHICTYRRTCR